MELLQQIEILEKSGLKPEGLDDFIKDNFKEGTKRVIKEVNDEDK